MPGNYGVTGSDVAAELPVLFPTGFDATTRPTAALVDVWIQRADDRLTLLVQRVSGVLPGATDAAYQLGKEYVIAYVKGKIMRHIYEGQAPERINAAAVPYFAEASAILKELGELKDQVTGTVLEGVTSKVRGEMPAPSRELTITDDDLDPVSGRQRLF